MSIIVLSCGKEEFANETTQITMNPNHYLNYIQKNGNNLILNSNSRNRITNQSQILTNQSFLIKYSDGFEAILVPVLNTINNKIEDVILGGNLNNESLYPTIEKRVQNSSFFNFTNLILSDSSLVDLHTFERYIYIDFEEELVYICNDDISYCEVYEAEVGSGGSSSSSNNNNEQGNDINNVFDNYFDNINNNGGGAGNQTTTTTINTAFIAEQIMQDLENCTSLSNTDINENWPLSDDQIEFLAVLIEDNLIQYNVSTTEQEGDDLPINNPPNFNSLVIFMENTSATNYQEFLEELLGFIDENSQYASLYRTSSTTSINWIAALGCSAMSSFFEINFANYTALKSLLANNPNALIEDCLEAENMDIEEWSNLYNFDIQPSTQDKLNELGFTNQPIEDGNATTINVDYYGVEIVNLPDLNGNGIQDETFDEIYSDFRLHFPELASGRKENFFFSCPIFIPHFVAGLMPYPVVDNLNWEFLAVNENENLLWNSTNPTDAAFYIDTYADNSLVNLMNDRGAVITSSYSGCCWVFSTVFTPETYSQPFSGNRQFGYRVNLNGNMEIYTKAIDVAHTRNLARLAGFLMEECDDLTYYDIAKATWENLQSNLKNYIELNGGSANILSPNQALFDREAIRTLLTSPTPVNNITCE